MTKKNEREKKNKPTKIITTILQINFPSYIYTIHVDIFIGVFVVVVFLSQLLLLFI